MEEKICGVRYVLKLKNLLDQRFDFDDQPYNYVVPFIIRLIIPLIVDIIIPLIIPMIISQIIINFHDPNDYRNSHEAIIILGRVLHVYTHVQLVHPNAMSKILCIKFDVSGKKIAFSIVFSVAILVAFLVSHSFHLCFHDVHSIF